MKKNDIIIIPDVHGRTFWKEAVRDLTDRSVIFLGDYLDPYQPSVFDFDPSVGRISPEDSTAVVSWKRRTSGDRFISSTIGRSSGDSSTKYRQHILFSLRVV